jgi:hypothetical protein
MDQTLRQICSVVAFQIKTIVVSTLLSLELGFHILSSSLVDLFWGKQPEQAEKVKETGGEAQDWVVIGNAESIEVQANGGKRKKVRPAELKPLVNHSHLFVDLLSIFLLIPWRRLIEVVRPQRPRMFIIGRPVLSIIMSGHFSRGLLELPSLLTSAMSLKSIRHSHPLDIAFFEVVLKS